MAWTHKFRSGCQMIWNKMKCAANYHGELINWLVFKLLPMTRYISSTRLQSQVLKGWLAGGHQGPHQNSRSFTGCWWSVGLSSRGRGDCSRRSTAPSELHGMVARWRPQLDMYTIINQVECTQTLKLSRSSPSNKSMILGKQPRQCRIVFGTNLWTSWEEQPELWLEPNQTCLEGVEKVWMLTVFFQPEENLKWRPVKTGGWNCFQSRLSYTDNSLILTSVPYSSFVFREIPKRNNVCVTFDTYRLTTN